MWGLGLRVAKLRSVFHFCRPPSEVGVVSSPLQKWGKGLNEAEAFVGSSCTSTWGRADFGSDCSGALLLFICLRNKDNHPHIALIRKFFFFGGGGGSCCIWGCSGNARA